MSFFLLRKLLEKVRSAVNATRDHPSELAASYQVIRGLAQQRSWLELEKACREILDEKTETPEVWVLLAYSLQQQGRHAESVEFATRAAKLLPSQWHPNFLAGVALKAVGKNSEACENLKRAAAIFPEDEQTRRELLEAQAASESIVAAVSAYSAACSQTENPQSIVAATIHTIDTWISLSGAAVPSNRAVEEIANVRIFSGSNLLISSDGCAIMDNNEPTQYGSVVIAKEIEIVLLDTGKFHNREIETGAYLCGPTSSDPDYWMLAFLPKLELLRQHAHFMDVPIIVDADMPQSHFDQLAKLVSNPLILLEPSESISCQRLLVAACPEFLPLLEKIHEVRKLEQQKNWIKLEEHCREILAEHSAMTEPMALLAYSMQQQGRLSDAAELATRATALMPTSWLANFIAGVTLFGLEKPEQAVGFLKQANALAPGDKQTIRQLIGAIAVSEGIEAAAMEYSTLSHQAGPDTQVFIAPVKSTTDWASMIGLPLLNAGEIEEIPFKNPHIWGCPASTQTEVALSNKPYVVDIPNARIFSNSSLILTADGTALSDTGGHPTFGHYVSFAYESIVVAQARGKVLLNLSEMKTREVEGGIFLSGLASSAFGHWLPEFLPKLEFLRYHPEFDKLPIIIDAQMPPSHYDHLRRLASNPIILLQPNESLQCKRLLTAPSPAFLPVELLPNDIPIHELPGLSLRAMRFLQGEARQKNTTTPTKRLFLARKNMKWRRLLNEVDISNDLIKLSFETVFLEDLTADEQITLFGQAQWIVAPNGSALLNIIFADPSVKLLVLTQPNLHNWGTFQGPVDALGYQSICVTGSYATAEENKHSDYYIPIEHIRQALFDWGMHEALDPAIISENTKNSL